MRSRGYVWAMTLALSACVIGINAAPALALSPSVETTAASSIQEKGATLNGKVNPNGAETKMYFEYGSTTSYGSKTAEVNVGSGTTTLEKSQAISGLSANTLYHYRIVAVNSSGTSQGTDRTFTTAGPPAVSGTGSFPEANGQEATLKGTVDPNGQSTTYQFEYGTSFGVYPNVAPIPAASAGSGFEPVAVEQKITGLSPGQKYYWRLSATNAGGKQSTLFPLSFLSSKHPGIEGVGVSGLWRTEAGLNATVRPNGSATTYYFEYGTTASYGSKTTTKEIAAGVESKAASEPISGLKENTLYHYRVVATNSVGTHTGPDQTFTTLAGTTLYPKGGGEPLKTLAALKLFSSNLGFSGESGSHSCNEAEISGIVKENPGALHSVSEVRLQQGKLACEWKTSYTIKYSAPSGFNIEYAKNASGESFVRTGKFTLVQAVYFNWFSKVGECEFNLSLTGSSAAGVVEPTLSGTTELVKSSGTCPGAETLSGKFALTSGGTAVEAK